MNTDLLERAPSTDEFRREVSRIKTMVRDAVDDGVEAAVKAIKQGRSAAEDAVDEAKYRVKHKPFESVGIVFAVGLMAGAFLTWAGSRRRRHW